MLSPAVNNNLNNTDQSGQAPERTNYFPVGSEIVSKLAEEAFIGNVKSSYVYRRIQQGNMIGGKEGEIDRSVSNLCFYMMLLRR